MVISGTVDFDVDCEIEVHSDNPAGLTINGSSPCVESAGIGVVGGYRVNGNLNPDCFDPEPVGGMMYDDDPIHHALYVEDPPSLQEPDVTTAYPDLVSACIWDTEISGDQTLWPGYYCGSSYDVTTCAPLAPFACTTQTFYHPAIKISGGTVYLKSGVYYLDSGMHISGGTITHDPNEADPGVLFYNTNQFWANPPPRKPRPLGYDSYHGECGAYAIRLPELPLYGSADMGGFLGAYLQGWRGEARACFRWDRDS